MQNLSDSLVRQVESSSALTFARALLHAAEGKELFDHDFLFASAVATYYSLFHLGGALLLAYWSHPSSPADHHASIRNSLEQNWRKLQSRVSPDPPQHLPDPAQAIRHDDVPRFLEQELPELCLSLGRRNERCALRDMREFVSYAPRMVNDGQRNVLYSGCQYELPTFRTCLGKHLSRLDEFFSKSTEWIARKHYTELHQRILSADFILFEFDELCTYYSNSCAKRAWKIYRSVCEQQKVDWRVYRLDPTTFRLDQDDPRRRYSEIMALLGD